MKGLGAVLCLLALTSCQREADMLVHVYHPKDFAFQGNGVLKGDTHVSLYLSPGKHDLKFKTASGDQVVTLNILHSGGESYIDIDQEDLGTTIDVEEAR